MTATEKMYFLREIQKYRKEQQKLEAEAKEAASKGEDWAQYAQECERYAEIKKQIAYSMGSLYEKMTGETPK